MNNKYYYTYSRVRDKKTGKIGVLQSITHGSCKDNNGVIHNHCYNVKLCGEENTEIYYYEENDFEYIDHDFSDITSQIMEFIKKDNRNKGIPEIIARRLDPDYFSIGSIVFFLESGWIDRTADYKYGSYGSTFHHGPAYPYMIVDSREIICNYNNINNYDYDIRFELILVPYTETLRKSGKSIDTIIEEIDSGKRSSVIVPLSLTHFFEGDAYSILSRYDKEY